MNKNTFADNHTNIEKVKEEPSALREKAKPPQKLSKKKSIKCWTISSSRIRRLEKSLSSHKILSKFGGGGAFANLQKNFDNGAYIVAKCLKKTQDELHIVLF